MWVFTKHGFYSIVEDRSAPGNLLVRSRARGDIRSLLGIRTAPEYTPDADYAFRASVPRPALATALLEAVADIDYDNFKNAVVDEERVPFYLRVWQVMANMQDVFVPKPKPARSQSRPSAEQESNKITQISPAFRRDPH